MGATERSRWKEQMEAEGGRGRRATVATENEGVRKGKCGPDIRPCTGRTGCSVPVVRRGRRRRWGRQSRRRVPPWWSTLSEWWGVLLHPLLDGSLDALMDGSLDALLDPLLDALLDQMDQW